MRVAEVHEPESYAEAAKDTNLHAAMEEEMHTLTENETCELVDALKGVKSIGCRWVYKVMYKTNGSINQYEAWFLAKGYVQQHGIDYYEMFARVVKKKTICVRLAVAAAKGWHLHQMDVKNSYKVNLRNRCTWCNHPDFIPN